MKHFTATLDRMDINQWYNPENWSHSLNWSQTEYPQSSADVTDASPLSYLLAADASLESQETAYPFETTRPASEYTKYNANPAIVLKGEYTIDGTAQTFYRYGEESIFTDDEYWTAMAASQTAIFKSGKVAPTASELKAIASSIHPYDANGKADQLVTIQLNPEASLTDYVDADGNAITDISAINKKLAQECIYMEKYENGLCYFTVPIKHKNYKENSETQDAGAFGLVRNHQYTINIQSISGIGKGIASKTMYLLESEVDNEVKSYNVTSTITVKGWDKVDEQNVTI